jgi:hypothetical protein
VVTLTLLPRLGHMHKILALIDLLGDTLSGRERGIMCKMRAISPFAQMRKLMCPGQFVGKSCRKRDSRDLANRPLGNCQPPACSPPSFRVARVRIFVSPPGCHDLSQTARLFSGTWLSL